MKDIPPLFLPTGSVRDIVILMFSAGLVYALIAGRIDGETFFAFAGPLIGAHFGLRHRQSGPGGPS